MPIKRPSIMNLDQIAYYGSQDELEVILRTNYGPWTFNPNNLTLTLQNGRYEVDLEKMITSARTLDTIFQVQSKTWATPQIMFNLLQAIEDKINPQGTLCSSGIEHGPIDVLTSLTKRQVLAEQSSSGPPPPFD